jgi:hypothetical protein
MPIGHYIIQMTAPPYSRATPQAPLYMDELRTNWSGYPLFGFDRYLVQVNTTDAKHDQLEGRAGVMSLRRLNLDDTVGSLPSVARNRVRGYLTDLGLPYDANETIDQLIRRVITVSDPNGGDWNPKRTYVDEF